MIGDSGQIWIRRNNPAARQQVKPGTVRRILPYTRQYRWAITLLLAMTTLDAIITAATPLILGLIIDQGIQHKRPEILLILSLVVAGLSLVDAAAVYIQTLYSSRISEGFICDLRTQVFQHVQQQSLAFFTRTQTGSLVSRMNNDINGAQQAVTSLLSQAVSSILTLSLVLAAIFYLSWQLSLVALILIPLFIVPGKLIGKRLQRLTREEMQLEAELATMATERFNVAGALLAKLYGRPAEETGLFANRAIRVRDISIVTNVNGRTFYILMTLIASLATALVYGLGGDLVVRGAFQIGSLVAMIALLTRLYAPINQLSNMQLNVMTALVAFDRVFEILDLKSLIAERPNTSVLPDPVKSGIEAPTVEFDRVSFRYPKASEVSLASLESIALPERASNPWVLHEVSFRAPAGKLTALVGPSGAGKTTITHLVPRLYDPSSGTVRIEGQDIRDLTLDSLHDTVGVVPQESHLFHETIRSNLTYARPDATEQDLIDACEAARIWDLISSLPDGLDTVVGDRGYRFSGGEKQRVALARLLLKAPTVVVLDEATAHLDSESEAAIQRALKTALAGRTSLVIAHRLSTIREADQILVINEGQIAERGTHHELLAADGLYAELYHVQFAHQEADDDDSAASSSRAR